MRTQTGPVDRRAVHRVLAQNWWAVLIRGIAAIVFGLGALLVPGAVMVTLALLFAAYLVVDGEFAVTSFLVLLSSC